MRSAGEPCRSAGARYRWRHRAVLRQLRLSLGHWLAVLDWIGAAGISALQGAATCPLCRLLAELWADQAIWRWRVISAALLAPGERCGALPPWRGGWRPTAAGCRESVPLPITQPSLDYEGALAADPAEAAHRVLREHAPTPARFWARYQLPGVPCALAGVTVVSSPGDWAPLELAKRCQSVRVMAQGEMADGRLRWAAADYWRYVSDGCGGDSEPLLLFEPTIPAHLAAGLTVPCYFTPNGLALAEHAAPERRWLVGGPRGSGSRFHVDPHGSSAWNVLIRGVKRWALFPPAPAPPPGVHAAAQPSAAEWYRDTWPALRRDGADRRGMLEVVQREGEIVYVPRGWWHATLNLSGETVAYTENYVSEENGDEAIDVLHCDGHSEAAERLQEWLQRSRRRPHGAGGSPAAKRPRKGD